MEPEDQLILWERGQQKGVFVRFISELPKQSLIYTRLCCQVVCATAHSGISPVRQNTHPRWQKNKRL